MSLLDKIGLGRFLRRKDGDEEDFEGEDDYGDDEIGDDGDDGDDAVRPAEPATPALPPPDRGEDDDVEFDEDFGEETEKGGDRFAALKAKVAGLLGKTKVADLLENERTRRMVIGGGIAVGVLLIGGLALLLFSGGEEEADSQGIAKIELKVPPRRGGGMVSPPESDRPPAETPPPEHPEGSAPAEGPAAAPASAPASSARSLNAIAAAEIQGVGTGVQIPAVMPDAYSALAAMKGDIVLATAADPALLERSSKGLIPRVGPNNRMAWQAYARPFNPSEDRPRIAIIVAGLGLSRSATEAAIKLLPGAVTLAFDPYGRGLQDWIAPARQQGHELLITLPLESERFPIQDPGPMGLLTSVEPAENMARLESVLVQASVYVGVLTTMGARFNSAEDKLKPVLEAIKGRGLMVVDGSGVAKTKIPETAAEIGLPRAVVNVVIDTDPARAAIDARLQELATLARSQAFVVGLAHPYPSTIERIAAWAATLGDKDVVLAPVSAVADRQM